MPPLTRWFIKTSLVYFILALTVGLLLAVQGIWSLSLRLAGMFPVYIHLLVEGWLTLLIMGVVFWMFPKYTRDRPRGSEALGWATYILVNVGLIIRVISEPINTQQPAMLWGWLLVTAAVLQWSGGMAFVANTWSRVKEK
jgi:hypothetical protein